jgi:hypothetical protein
MSYFIRQDKIPMPLDKSLPRHAMFRRTDDDKWQVNLFLLFKKLPQPRGTKAIWYKTCQSMVQRLPSDYLRSEIREIGAVSYDEIDKNTWISVRTALVLLTYGSRNHKHLEIVQWVEQYTGVRLPRQKGLSRREIVFGHKLRTFIDNELTDITYGDYELQSQRRMCNGKYYVDFAVKHYWNGDEDKDNYYLYLIEFDEEEHALAPNRAADLIRDTEIKKDVPQASIIRVKHDESDDWFDLVRVNNRLIGFESAFLGGIIAACSTVEDGFIIIDSNSAMKAYDSRKNINADMLIYEKQPLRGIKEALNKCGIRCIDGRTRKRRQLKVPLESFTTVLHRWLPDGESSTSFGT